MAGLHIIYRLSILWATKVVANDLTRVPPPTYDVN